MRISDWSSDVCSSDLQQQCRSSLPCCWLHYAGRVNSSVRPHDRHSSAFLRCVDCFARLARAHRHQDARPVSIVIGQAFVICRRSEEHTSELQSLMRISYAVFCLKKKKQLYINQSQTLT